MYAEAEVVVEGALDIVTTFTDEEALNGWIDYQMACCRDDGVHAKVFVLWHDHEPDIDCECIQYKPDHHPYATTEDTDA